MFAGENGVSAAAVDVESSDQYMVSFLLFARMYVLENRSVEKVGAI